jgi:catechol 2,3-dioxygenase-like lactoylglutathione lyase family enzyme
MPELPALRVLAVVQDLAAIERTMSQVFGMTNLRRHSEAGYEAASVGFNNGELLLVAPRCEGGRSDDLLSSLDPGLVAVGALTSHPSRSVEGQALAGTGPLAGIRLWCEPISGLRLFAGEHSSINAVTADIPYALDHVAAVVHDLESAARAITAGIGMPVWHRDWYFPEFGTTNLCVQARESYIEFNKPENPQGLFGAMLAKSGPGFAFLCLRADSFDARMSELKQGGIAIADTRRILAVPPGEQRAIEIGSAHALARASVSGLRIILFDSWWPWKLEDQRVAARRTTT